MRGLSTEDLSAHALGLAGWPWSESCWRSPERMPNGAEWPLISVVTPSLNQGAFLERAIRSVLLQGYPRLEYIVIDGGSTDESLRVIEKYAPRLAYWVSEPDGGYIQAINKGFRRATGDIMCWLSSDDFYTPGALHAVSKILAPGSGNVAAVGHVLKVYADGRPSQKLRGHYAGLNRLLKFWLGYEMHQPSIFWRREVFEAVGFLDETKDLVADFDYWVRIARRFPFRNVGEVLACATYHAGAKTGDDYRRYHEQLKAEAARYRGSPLSPSYWLLRASMTNHYSVKPRLRPALSFFDYYGAAALHHLRARMGRS